MQDILDFLSSNLYAPILCLFFLVYTGLEQLKWLDGYTQEYEPQEHENRPPYQEDGAKHRWKPEHRVKRINRFAAILFGLTLIVLLFQAFDKNRASAYEEKIKALQNDVNGIKARMDKNQCCPE